jgi:hypothetical protein
MENYSKISSWSALGASKVWKFGLGSGSSVFESRQLAKDLFDASGFSTCGTGYGSYANIGSLFSVSGMT